MYSEYRTVDPYSIIVIEDNLGDFVLIEDYLIEVYKTVQIKHFTDYLTASSYLEDQGQNDNLILLDIHLPDKKGFELIESLSRGPHHIPIIILTGYEDLPLAKSSLELGVYDFLVKDEINPNLLHKSIEFAISRYHYVQQLENRNTKLKNIAWTQSHVLRAPLTRLLSIIGMLENSNENQSNLAFWLNELKTSSEELDQVIHNIVRETEISRNNS